MRTWSPAKQAGFALAALVCDDRELTHAAAALGGSTPAEVRAWLLPSDVQGQRAQRIARILSLLRPALSHLPTHLPPRALALLAPKLPRPLAREALCAAPRAEPGYEAPSDLLPRLLRIARMQGEPTRAWP